MPPHEGSSGFPTCVSSPRHKGHGGTPSGPATRVEGHPLAAHAAAHDGDVRPVHVAIAVEFGVEAVGADRIDSRAGLAKLHVGEIGDVHVVVVVEVADPMR